jgi:hypothetical protein
MVPSSRGLSSGRTLARGHREAYCGLKIWNFHPHDSTKTRLLIARLNAAVPRNSEQLRDRERLGPNLFV